MCTSESALVGFWSAVGSDHLVDHLRVTLLDRGLTMRQIPTLFWASILLLTAIGLIARLFAIRPARVIPVAMRG